MNSNWPFSSFFLDLYASARYLKWEYNDKPVTIAWLLGFHSSLIPHSIDNPFSPNSLAWNDFCNGFNSCAFLSHKYPL